MPVPTQSTKISEIINNINDYRFECHAVVLVPQIQVFDKNNKMIFETEMNSMFYDGTMTAPYAEQLFKDINDGLKESFVHSIMQMRAAKNKETHNVETEGRPLPK